MSVEQRHAARVLGEHDPLTFMRVWFQISQADRLLVNWHHRLFNLHAKRVLSGECQNLIVNVPPGGTKTEFWSVHLPVYCFAKYPRVRILNTSYSKSLVEENSTRGRDVVKGAEWQEVYGHDVGKDKVDDWTINTNGKRAHQLFSRPSSGQIIGVRGGYISRTFSGYIMLDDWDKADDMFSETRRKAGRRRLSNTLRSRRAAPTTPVIAVQQRLHTQDSTAFLLSGGLGMEFEHIKIPALINEEYIQSLPKEIQEHCRRDVCHTEQINGYWSYWPAKEDVHDLQALWESDPYTFCSQYLQDPETLSGGIFDPDWLLLYGEDADVEAPPAFEYRFTTGDTAQKTKERHDFTVFVEWGVWQGNIYGIRLLRGKWEAPALRSNFTSFVNAAWDDNSVLKGNLREVTLEDKASGTGLIQETSSKLPLRPIPIQRNTDKLTRAMDVAGFIKDGRVRLPYGAPWVPEFIAEVCSFQADDSHKHDDQTDNMLDAVDRVILAPHKAKKQANMLIPTRKKR